MPPVRISRIELPWRTIFKIILTLVLTWLLVQLSSLVLLFVIALLATAALHPALAAMERRSLSRGAALSIIFLLILAVIALALAVIIPPIITEGSNFIDRLPDYVQPMQDFLKNRYPSVYQSVQDYLDQQAATGTLPFDVTRILSVGQGVVGGIRDTLIVFVLTAYLLLDGERIYNWLVRYLPDHQEVKVRTALPLLSRVVSGYVVGQLLTSLLFGIYAFTVLTLAGVPQAVFLALVAALLDAVPVIGAFIATVPAFLLALTISTPAAIAVLVAYTAYQQVENYFIVPRVYRGTMQISAFAVLVAVLVGGELLGVVGILLALPLAAAIPVIEKVWIPNGTPSRTKASDPFPVDGGDAG